MALLITIALLISTYTVQNHTLMNTSYQYIPTRPSIRIYLINHFINNSINKFGLFIQ